MPDTNSPYPSAYDNEKADEIWAVLSKQAAESGMQLPNPGLHRAVAGNSPFLAGIMERHPKVTLSYLSSTPDTQFDKLIAELRDPRPAGETLDQLMISLREYKAKVSLLVAIADISAQWSLGKVTKSLSDFADTCLQVALAHLLHTRMKAGDIPWPDGKEQAVTTSLSGQSGYFILGMGKLGAQELNYSSDIDLIVLYDPALVDYHGRKTLPQCYVKLTQELVQIMDKRTMHGYVFRTDLRLRPDPGATPVAIAVDAAESYYHSMAVNWERSAMIKARVVAGDERAGAAFLANMGSWVWRRSMDFVALKDIAAIKNQINHHYDQKNSINPGYNVKLGYGGIREIEFFAQINQLLHAGRHPELRIRSTIEALTILKKLEIIGDAALSQLQGAYVFFRTLEHRIQMVDDAQTHQLPEDEAGLSRLAVFMGTQGSDELLYLIKGHSQNVTKHYDALMPESSSDESPALAEQNLEQTLETLGFVEVASSAAIIDGWRRGRYRAVRTEKAKGLLEQCLPEILAAFSKTDNPSAALVRFDNFISQLPAGVQLFSLLQANPSLFKLLGRIMGLAPALAGILAKKPELWDILLEPSFYTPVENEEHLNDTLSYLLDNARDFQDVLDQVRRFVAEQKFRTGIHLMEGLSSVEETGGALTRIADATLKALIPRVEAEFATKHGFFPDGGIAVLAMGKYGGQELTHTSDLDIVFLYHCEDMKTVSNGAKPLSPSQYFSRLGQHIITAITALTPEGRLFEVDTRLRPSGSQGPLVVTLQTFRDYYANSAWTWEQMALTRARVVLAPQKMKDSLDEAVHDVLTSNRDKDALLRAAADMRNKLFNQFGSENIWAIKHCRGGLVDMEFICQYLMLREGHKTPELFEPEITKAINKLEKNQLLTTEEAAMLSESHDYLQKIQSLLRLCIGPAPQSSEEIPEGLRQILIQATGSNTFGDIEQTIATKQDEIYKLYQKLIELPSIQQGQKSGE